MQVNEKKKFIASFSIIALCAIVLCAVIGITVAWYIDYKRENATLDLGKVELGAQTLYQTSLNLSDVIAGTQILSQPLRVNKMADSVPIYIRAKVSFTINPNQVMPDTNILENYLVRLREHTSFNFYRKAQNGATWSYRYGNYVYLVGAGKEEPNSNGTNENGERMFLCNDTFIYILTKSINLPMSLYQDDGHTQFGKSIIFHFAFQAIQGVELENYSFNSLVSIFDSSFPETYEEENYYLEKSKDADINYLKKYSLTSNLSEDGGGASLSNLTSGVTLNYTGGGLNLNNLKLKTTYSHYSGRNIFSMTFWAKIPSSTYAAGTNIISLGAVDKEGNPFDLSFEIVNASGSLLDLKGGNVASEGVKQVSSSQTEFVHYAIISDGDQFIIYVNSELAGFMTHLEEGWTLTSDIIIGDAAANGLIKDLRIYREVVSPCQIADTYNGN